MFRPVFTGSLVLLTGCLAGWRPPASEGWDEELWFVWEPANDRLPDGPGQAWRWTVPEGVGRISIEAWGAGGGGSVARPEDRVNVGYGGGAGGWSRAEVAVVPGQVLVIVPGRGGDVGGRRGAGAWTSAPPDHPWLGGGGPGAPITGPRLPELRPFQPGDRPGCQPLDPEAAFRCTGAGAGGGWSGVFLADDLSEIEVDGALVLAGGGGGAGAGGPGGDGGGPQGDDAPPCGIEGASRAGSGGGQGRPGGGGARALTLDDERRFGGFGAALLGGSGGMASPHLGLGGSGGGARGGGGGGGGRWGGGGGANTLPNAPGCGGGGGSGWVPDVRGQMTTGGAPEVEGPGGQVLGAGGAPGAPGGGGGVRIRW